MLAGFCCNCSGKRAAWTTNVVPGQAEDEKNDGVRYALPVRRLKYNPCARRRFNKVEEIMGGHGPSAGLIGVFDSGVGGLSVWREIARQFPQEDTLYVADQAHMPYGSRSLDEVRAYCEGVVHFMLEQGAKAAVIACNSASAAALRHVRDLFPQVPIVGMEPAIKPAVQNTRKGVVGVIATQATFQGRLFASLIEQYGNNARVLAQVGRGLAQAVESGALDTPETEALLRECLTPLIEAGVDHLVLGCTHYPFLLPAIERLMGPEVAIVDPAPAVARQTGRLLMQRNLVNSKVREARHLFYTSGDADAFAVMIRRLIPACAPHAEVMGACWQGERLQAKSSELSRNAG